MECMRFENSWTSNPVSKIANWLRNFICRNSAGTSTGEVSSTSLDCLKRVSGISDNIETARARYSPRGSILEPSETIARAMTSLTYIKNLEADIL